MAWIRIERVTWAERALWAAFVVASVAPVALQPAPEEIARSYVAAINRGDVDAALALTTTDFVIRPVLGGYYYRREEARKVLEWRAALNERWRVVSWAYDPRDREVYGLFEVTNDAWRLIAPPPTMEVVLVMREGGLLMEGIRTGARDLRRPLEPFLAWAGEERPLALGRVWRNRQPVLDEEAAGRLLELVRAWRAAEGSVAEAPAPAQP
ncbi:MAG TPA: hypothetical protein VMR66_10825 [Gemmatimonadota bacterium]|nr:hypothetical protein [Gemmatimonadota bacterium]